MGLTEKSFLERNEEMGIFKVDDQQMNRISYEKSSLSVCPTCGKVAAWNSYFGCYRCNYCGWEGLRDKTDETDLKERIKELELVLRELNRHLDSAVERQDGKDIWSIRLAATQLQLTINRMKKEITQ